MMMTHEEQASSRPGYVLRPFCQFSKSHIQKIHDEARNTLNML